MPLGTVFESHGDSPSSTGIEKASRVVKFHSFISLLFRQGNPSRKNFQDAPGNPWSTIGPKCRCSVSASPKAIPRFATAVPSANPCRDALCEMDQAAHNKIVSFIWGIAADVLRDLFKRGKYPYVILPMCVLRRMDAVLEPTKKAVLENKEMLDQAGITEQRAALASAAGQAFYNTSKFTLRDLKSRGSQQQLLADFEDYLNGFSQNVQDILENFKFRNQLSTLSKSDSLGTLINKFLDPEINLSPDPVLNSDGSTRHPGMDNHSMGTVFEELVCKFNEENNEEAGEHWTPRDAVRLMANVIFLPIADRIKSGRYLLYDCACGTGGMLTVAEETLQKLATWFNPLRKNLGKKNCELAPDDVQPICDAYLKFEETPQSKIFPNAAFGYWKVTVERPLRLHSQLAVKAIETLRFASGE